MEMALTEIFCSYYMYVNKMCKDASLLIAIGNLDHSVTFLGV